MMRAAAIFFLGICLTAPARAGVDEILAANRTASGGDAWNGKAVLALDYRYSGQGLTGTTSSTIDLATGRFVDRYDLGAVSGANGFDGVQAWAKDPSGAVTAQQGGATLPLAFNEAYRGANMWWRPQYGGAAITLAPDKSDKDSDAVAVTPKGGEQFYAWFDKKTHLLVRIFEQQGSTPLTSTYSDYQRVEGAEIAGRTVQSTGNARYDQVFVLAAAKFLPVQPDTAFAMPKNEVADFSIAGGAHEATLPFKLINNHIYADVKVNGSGPYTFIFDTGGENIVTPMLAKSLGLAITGHIEARGAGSGTMEAGYTKVKLVGLGAASISNQPFGAFALDALSDVEGFDETGMIGFETFRRFVTRIDYGKRVITLIDPKSFDARHAGVALPLYFDGNVAEIDASYDGISGRFQLDTGARSSLTLTGPFVAKNKLRERAARGVESVTGWGVGGPTRSFVERGAPLTLGSLTIDKPVVELSSDTGGAMAEGDIAGNIGAGILKRYVVTLDYEHGRVYLKPIAGNQDDLDTFDRMGAWFNRDPKGFKVIDVTAHAPAQEAGLAPGDIVTQVDGKNATSVALYDLRYRLRNDPAGTKVTLTILRKRREHAVMITLRDLI